MGVLKRTITEFKNDNLTDWAAALTYYMVMSLFPGLLLAVSLLGLAADPTMVTDATRYLEDAGAPES